MRTKLPSGVPHTTSPRSPQNNQQKNKHFLFFFFHLSLHTWQAVQNLRQTLQV